MENEVKKGLKPWIANLIIFFVELIILVLYFAIGWSGIKNIFSGNISGGFDEVAGAIWFLNVAILIVTLLCFFVKQLRTKANIRWGIWNIIWIAGNIYLLASK